MNVSISELIVILLIALLVVKPEQLPDVAMTIGRFARSIKSMFAKVKNEMNSLMDADEQQREQR